MFSINNKFQMLLKLKWKFRKFIGIIQEVLIALSFNRRFVADVTITAYKNLKI
jgi:hypothetical protein